MDDSGACGGSAGEPCALGPLVGTVLHGVWAGRSQFAGSVGCCLCPLAFLVVDPEIPSLEDVLVGAFLYTLSAGADRPLAAIGATAIGLGIAAPMVAHALRWRYPDQVQYCRARALHLVEGALVPLVAWLVGPVHSGGSVPAGQGRTFLCDWARELSCRRLLVEGRLPNQVGAAVGHPVGVTADRQVFCTTFGHFWSGYGAGEKADVLIRHLQRVWQIRYLVLPPQDLVGSRPRVLGGRRLPRLALARGRGESVEGCGGCAGGLEEEENTCPQAHGGACFSGIMGSGLLMASGGYTLDPTLVSDLAHPTPCHVCYHKQSRGLPIPDSENSLESWLVLGFRQHQGMTPPTPKTKISKLWWLEDTWTPSAAG